MEQENLRPGSVLDAATSGDTEGMLRASLMRIASAIDDPETPARDLAALTKRLMDTEHELQAAHSAEDGGEGVEVEDEPFDPSAL